MSVGTALPQTSARCGITDRRSMAGPALATLSIHKDRSAGPVHCNVWLGGMGANPVDCSLGVRVGRKHGIDAVQNTSLPDDEREALEQTHALDLERRQPQGC